MAARLTVTGMGIWQVHPQPKSISKPYYKGPSGDIIGSVTLTNADGGAIYRDNDGNVLARASHD